MINNLYTGLHKSTSSDDHRRMIERTTKPHADELRQEWAYRAGIMPQVAPGKLWPSNDPMRKQP